MQLAQDDRTGTVLGHYRLLGKIGAGGMGSVYVGEHLVLGRRAAIKILLPGQSGRQDAAARFLNEARTLAKVKHRGLVEVYDFGTDERGEGYLVMELVEGESLDALLRRAGRLPPATAVDLARQLAVALQVAHESGIVHRDLKPENVLLVGADGALQVKVVDFGIAKLLDEAGGSNTHTRTGAIVGTPLFMSPEQCRANVTVDHRADVYALGCLLYAMACGRPPFVSDSPGELIAAHIYETPPRPTALVPSLSPALGAIILRALAKRPEDRLQTMAELDAALAACSPSDASGAAEVPVARAVVSAPTIDEASTAVGAAAPPVPAASGAGRPSPRRWALIAGLGAAAVGAVSWGWSRQRPPLPLATRVTFSRPQPLDRGDGRAFQATDVGVNPAGVGLAVWAESDGEGEVVVLARQFDRATGWGPAETVERAAGQSVDSVRARVDGGGARLAAWRVEGPSGKVARVARSSGSQRPWEVVAVAGGATPSRGVRLAVNDAGVAAVACDEDLPSGRRASVRVFVPERGWGALERLDVAEPPAASSPSLAVDAQGRVLALWGQAEPAGGLWSRRRSEAGVWEAPVRVSRPGRGRVDWPKLAANERGDALATWEEKTGGAGQGWASAYTAAAGWGQPAPLGEPSINGVSPVPALGEDGAAAVVLQAREGNALVLRTWRAGTWSAARIVATGSPIYPSVDSAAGGAVLVVWSRAGGDLWASVTAPGSQSAVEQAIGTGVGTAFVPHLASARDGHGLVVWTQLERDNGPRRAWASTY